MFIKIVNNNLSKNQRHIEKIYYCVSFMEKLMFCKTFLAYKILFVCVFQCDKDFLTHYSQKELIK